MKWIEQNLDLSDTPVDNVITIEGNLENNKVSINVALYNLSTDEKWFVNEWSDTLNMWQYQEINNDDLRFKYSAKVDKIIKKYGKISYSEWYKIFLSKGPLKV